MFCIVCQVELIDSICTCQALQMIKTFVLSLGETVCVHCLRESTILDDQLLHNNMARSSEEWQQSGLKSVELIQIQLRLKFKSNPNGLGVRGREERRGGKKERNPSHMLPISSYPVSFFPFPNSIPCSISYSRTSPYSLHTRAAYYITCYCF